MTRNNWRNFLCLTGIKAVKQHDRKKPVFTIIKSGTIALLTIGTANATLAETFSIDGTALNTNSRFPRVDGNPIMSTWPLNNTDSDQQFDVLSGANGRLLRHKSTGLCLNAHYLSNGGKVNTWPCNANDPDQNFTINSFGNNIYSLQRSGSNFCVDMPNRSANQQVILWQCNQGANQRFTLNAGGNNGNPDLNLNVVYDSSITPAQRALFTKAILNWDSIITRDMVNQGPLKIYVKTGSMTVAGPHWAETDAAYTNTPRLRQALPSGYHAVITFKSSIINSLDSNRFIRLATHELGHALYLDEAQKDTSLGLGSIMHSVNLTEGITEGVYQKLEQFGYSVNRSPSIQWR